MERPTASGCGPSWHSDFVCSGEPWWSSPCPGGCAVPRDPQGPQGPQGPGRKRNRADYLWAMPILEKPLTRADLLRDYCLCYESMTKAVADLDSGAMAIEAVMHADLEQLLLKAGSRQQNLWGFNIYP